MEQHIQHKTIFVLKVENKNNRRWRLNKIQNSIEKTKYTIGMS